MTLHLQTHDACYNHQREMLHQSECSYKLKSKHTDDF